MSRFGHRSWLIPALLLFMVAPVLAQHGHEGGNGGVRFHAGAQAVGLITHATPAMLKDDLTEAYLTQPLVMAAASGWDGRLSFSGVLNLEGWTLMRGELNHGVWGEGYVDRRHPHTFLHEAMLTAREQVFGFDASISVGKGFVPFGTDDPMVRPFVKYPANHHLAQVLERLVVMGAVRKGPLVMEASAFNGDEPTRPEHNGTLDRFGDSWSVRATVLARGLELQASYAAIESPEHQGGGGLDQRKRSVSARLELPVGAAIAYALLEHARTKDMNNGVEAFLFTSTLAEASAELAGWQLSGRFENTTRPDEERTHDLFRSVRPAFDNSILGIWRFRTTTLNAARRMQLGVVAFKPFIEVARIGAEATSPFTVNNPRDMYGSETVWNLSAGVRLGAGMKHKRMGRYGVASN